MLQILPGKRLPSQFHALRHLLSRLQSRLFGPYAAGGSVNRTQTYLIMSHDSNEGSLTLTNDKPYLQFEGVGRTEHVKHLENVLAKATGAIGGTLVNSPFFAGKIRHFLSRLNSLMNRSFQPTGRDHGPRSGWSDNELRWQRTLWCRQSLGPAL